MKKIIYAFLIIFITGCSALDISNTPTKKVETYFNNYQILHEDVLKDLDKVIEEKINYDENTKKEYRELIKKQYKNMQYEIKEEKIDGDNAKVTVEIIVKDFTKTIEEAQKFKENNIEEFYEEGTYNENLYRKYLIEKLKESKEKITYTLELTLHKEDKKWVLDPISEENENKILGIYKY